MSDSTATVDPPALTQRPAPERPARSARAELFTDRRLARVALAGLVLCGVATVLCSASTVVLTPESLRLAPLAPGIIFGALWSVGPDLGLGGVIALFVLMCLCYLTLVRLGSTLSARAVVGAIVVLHVLLIWAPPLLSTDVFSYGDYGRMAAVYHFNPYVHGPSAVPYSDRWSPFIGSAWVTTPTVYGPVFTAMSYLLGHLSVRNATLDYRLITVACSLIMIAGVATAARRLGRDVTQAVLLVGLNPVLIVYAVGGDHNDLIMLAALSWALAALVAHRARLSGGLLVLATAVKLTAAIMLPFALAAHRGPAQPDGGQRRGHQRHMLVGGVLVLIGAGVLSTILFGSGPLHLLSTLEVVQADGKYQSIPGFISYGLGLGRLSHGVVIGLQALTVTTVVSLIVAVRKQRMDWITATGWAIVVLLVTSTYLLPWYVAWALPFAALSESRSLRSATLVLTAICMTSL